MILSNELTRNIERLAKHDCPVLVTGETGSGKEVVAREIHRRSRRSAYPMVALNCAAIPNGLVETELFGHTRGAFTGAVRDAPGKIRMAENGTIFLDEIAELDQRGQAKLLRVVETKEITAVGSGEAQGCNVRFMAATHCSLEPGGENALREDLFYRLGVGQVHVPPLRGQHALIRKLMLRFVAENNKALGRAVTGFDRNAMALLCEHAWPGNIRELRNLVEATFVNCEADVFGIEAIPEIHRSRLAVAGPHERLSDAAELLKALKASKGNKAQASRYLKCSRTTLYRRLNRLGATV